MRDDVELYKMFLNGNTEAFEELVLKYRNCITYFATTFVKNIEDAEDIFQETILYIFEHKFNYNLEYPFKTYIFTIAKSKSLDCLKKKKIMENIEEKDYTNIEKLEDIVFAKNELVEIKQTIKKLPKDYQIAIYLTQIEQLSYKEAAQIMSKSETQIKLLIYRARKKLKEYTKQSDIDIKNKNIQYVVIDKVFDKRILINNKNFLFRILVIIIILILLMSGIIYAGIMFYKNTIKTKIVSTTVEELGNTDINSIWVGTFQLAWNELMQEFDGDIQFQDYNSKLAEQLNRKLFLKEMLSSDDYYIKVGRTSNTLRKEIEDNLNSKFNIKDYSILDNIKWNSFEADTYTIFSYLYKNFEFNIPFDYLGEMYFNKNSSRFVRYFGINNASEENINSNVNVLFYEKNSYAIKLNSKEDEEIILYYSDNFEDSFEEIYNTIKQKNEDYVGNKDFSSVDEMMVPYISIDESINYYELCNHYIKDTDYYINNAFQRIKFELNESGGNVTSEATIVHSYNSGGEDIRYFYFNKPFTLFLKEKDSKKPYLSLYIKDLNYLN